MTNQKNTQEFIELVKSSKKILVIQAENPDGDSVASAMALEEILGDMGKIVTLYCPVRIPHYLGYINGWSRVTDDFPYEFDMSIIVDTASKLLLERAIIPENAARISKKPCIVIDHHTTAGDLPFDNTPIIDTTKVATGEQIFEIAKHANWKLNPQACEHLAISILSDSLGLITESTTSSTIRAIADLTDGGASLATIDAKRREYMKKSAEILEYKGKLLQRVEYHLNGELAIIHIPWEEIAKYSDQYNPTMLVIDEMRLVHGVKLAIGLKTYPDGKVTGKIRCNPGYKIAETIAKYFGGGGHPYVAGFKIYDEDYGSVKRELIQTVDKVLQETGEPR